MGRNWVEWDLPADRDVDTFWRMYVGHHALSYATHHKIVVRSTFGSFYCYQNKYGIASSSKAGYPGTVLHTSQGSVSMNVGTACIYVTVFRGGRYYCPSNNTDWPQHFPNSQPPFVSVWLK